MTREFRYLEDRDILLLRTLGTYELGAEVKTLEIMATELRKHSCNRCIIDHRNTNVIAKTMESYERSAVYEDLWDDRTIRTAIVFRELNEDYRFLETVCRNRGWDIRIFDDYDTGIDWLSEQGSA